MYTLTNAALQIQDQFLYRLVRRTVHPVLDLVRHAPSAPAAAGSMVYMCHGIALPGRWEPTIADAVVPAFRAETSHSGVLEEKREGRALAGGQMHIRETVTYRPNHPGWRR